MASLSGKFVKVSLPKPHVALVELSRAPVNAVNSAFWLEFDQIVEKIGQETDIRVVVLASSLPKFFTAGIDLTSIQDFENYDKDPARRALQIRSSILAFQRAISATERCPVPVIAAVHGIALGLAIDMITACDIRYAAANTTFSIKEVDVGLAADIGTLARLPKVTGNQSLINELTYTSRNFSAAEAKEIGLISKIVDGGREEVIEEALKLAEVIASKSPIAVTGSKHMLLHSRDHSVEDNLQYVASWNGGMLQTSDLKSSVQAALTKKKATYVPLGKPFSKL
ncbi:unnamed protein product [Somion occarium]|uniref:Uncharacterized protein n=1 Tax=Somion occarium TaxID=3059160 RepID=A0ABP1CNE9_9APHY